MRLLEAPLDSQQQSRHLHGFRNVMGRIGLSLALAAGPTLVNESLDESSAAASSTNPIAMVGMPFNGKWAWNGALVQPDANGNYSDTTSSHPSVHHRFGGDWATDLYDPAGTAVKLHATSADGTVTFTYNRSYDSCASAGANIAGHGIVLNVLVNGGTVGTIDYGHLDNLASSSATFVDGTTVGTITNEPFDTAGGCYTARHTHIELKNSGSTYACWTDKGNPGVSVNEASPIGQLGSTNTGAQQKCSDAAAPTTPTRPIPGDFDGNGYTNSAVFRPSDGYWHIRGDAGGGAGGDYQYGQAGDIPVPADYNGDGKTDVAVFRPSTGDWHIRGVGDFNYGQAGDIPVPGDYNADGKADIAVYRPSQSVGGENAWHIRGIGDFYYGHVGDIPTPGDYNSDAYFDIAVYRPSEGGWHIRGIGDWPHGMSTDIPVQGDYNGDGVTDSAIFRPSDGGWRVRAVGDWPYGNSTDIPVPGRYNNDSTWDSAVYRPSEGGWHVRGVGDWPYGNSTDIPAVQTLNAFLLKQYGLITNY